MDEVEEWEERTELTHAEQVDKFGWCVCEGTNGEGHLAKDCPNMETCERCESEVGSETLITLGDWKICEDCWGDI
jgi:hypothetical protein